MKSFIIKKFRLGGDYDELVGGGRGGWLDHAENEEQQTRKNPSFLIRFEAPFPALENM